MQQLNVVQINGIDRNTDLQHISDELDLVAHHRIDKVSWPQFPYCPNVSFAIAYAKDAILIKFFVEENTIRIVHHLANSPVYEDSCVEFFISFDDEENFYNFEFNCIGTCLAGFGKNRSDRKQLKESSISLIRSETMIKSSANGDGGVVNWTLTMVMPLETFIHHQISDLRGKKGRCNFYKCGDALPVPHFLTWKHVESPAPDFHLLQYFGMINFL